MQVFLVHVYIPKFIQAAWRIEPAPLWPRLQSPVASVPKRQSPKSVSLARSPRPASKARTPRRDP